MGVVYEHPSWLTHLWRKRKVLHWYQMLVAGIYARQVFPAQLLIIAERVSRRQALSMIDRGEAFMKTRINPVSIAADGSVYDVATLLTTFIKIITCVSQHVSSLMNAIAWIYEVARAIKHEPDGITQATLMKAMTEAVTDSMPLVRFG